MSYFKEYFTFWNYIPEDTDKYYLYYSDKSDNKISAIVKTINNEFTIVWEKSNGMYNEDITTGLDTYYVDILKLNDDDILFINMAESSTVSKIIYDIQQGVDVN